MLSYIALRELTFCAPSPISSTPNFIRIPLQYTHSARKRFQTLPNCSASITTTTMSDKQENHPVDYVPPKVWTEEAHSVAKIVNTSTAGARHETELPVGNHPIQLYSMGTPNGVKITILLEELLAAGVKEAEYDAHLIQIFNGDQFGKGFVSINPNSKIPAMIDQSGEKEISVFESGAILMYLAEKFQMFLPTSPETRAKCLSWLFWQVGSAPYVGGGFGHFYNYAPLKIKYCIDRFTMETKRQLDVLDQHLADREYLCDYGYSIADIAVYPWYGGLVKGTLYSAAEFLDVEKYTNVIAWVKRIEKRPAVQRGSIVNKTWGPPEKQLHERHDASDFDTKTQDKIGKTA